MVLGLKPGLKLDMFIHGKGEEVWLQFGAFPFMVSSALIDTMDENGPQVVKNIVPLASSTLASPHIFTNVTFALER